MKNCGVRATKIYGVLVGLGFLGLVSTHCGDAEPTAEELERLEREESALFGSGPRCPTAPDTATWRFGWQTVHGPVGAVWSSQGQVVRIEHVYEFRQGWGILIPNRTRRNCTRVWLENEDGSNVQRLTETPGQPNSSAVSYLNPPGDLVLSLVENDIARWKLLRHGEVVWSVVRSSEPYVVDERVISAPDASRYVHVRSLVSDGRPETPISSGSRLELHWLGADGVSLVPMQTIDFAGAFAWAAFDHAGRLLVSDGQTSFVFEHGGQFTSIASALCNPRAPTTSSAVDAQGRTIDWNGGDVVISAAGVEQAFGCM